MPVNSQGQTETKADFIRDYTAKGFGFAPFTIEKPIEKIWAAGAVLGGVVDTHGAGDGKPYAVRLRFADIWAKRNGRWQVIYTQARHALPGEQGARPAQHSSRRSVYFLLTTPSQTDRLGHRL